VLPLSSHLAANVSSASGEQVSEAYIPIVPVHEVGVIQVLGNAIAIARLAYSSLYASVRGSPSTVCFVYFYAIFSVNDLTIRMSLFALAFLLLLALGSLSLSRIVRLVLDHSPMIHDVVLFLNIGINICIAKLLLFSTPDQGWQSAVKDCRICDVRKVWQASHFIILRASPLWLVEAICDKVPTKHSVKVPCY
jgi:hypothetical protein